MIGHSFGGMVAAEIAATLRNRVSKLVLISALGLWRDDVPIRNFMGLTPEELVPYVVEDTSGAWRPRCSPRPTWSRRRARRR